MATVIELHDMLTGYRDVIEHVRDAGHETAPRGLTAFDVGPTLIVCEDPRDALAVGVGRRLSTEIAAVEAAMLVGGFCDEKLVTRVAPRLMNYADDSVTAAGEPTRKLHGAYGRRIGHQLQTALQKIRADPETRRAVITLWDPWLDNLPNMHDYPCTVALQLIMRHGKLDLDVTMRSSDVWRGLPYDVFQFSQLLITAARVLDLPLGTYYHMAWSLHLYATDLGAVDELLSTTTLDAVRARSHFQPQGFGQPGHSLADVQRRIQSLVTGSTARAPLCGRSAIDVASDDRFTVSEAWYGERLCSSPFTQGSPSREYVRD